jgi:hypothetical protein
MPGSAEWDASRYTSLFVQALSRHGVEPDYQFCVDTLKFVGKLLLDERDGRFAEEGPNANIMYNLEDLYLNAEKLKALMNEYVFRGVTSHLIHALTDASQARSIPFASR